jgi:hypothetical protein
VHAPHAPPWVAEVITNCTCRATRQTFLGLVRAYIATNHAMGFTENGYEDSGDEHYSYNVQFALAQLAASKNFANVLIENVRQIRQDQNIGEKREIFGASKRGAEVLKLRENWQNLGTKINSYQHLDAPENDNDRLDRKSTFVMPYILANDPWTLLDMYHLNVGILAGFIILEGTHLTDDQFVRSGSFSKWMRDIADAMPDRFMVIKHYSPRHWSHEYKIEPYTQMYINMLASRIEKQKPVNSTQLLYEAFQHLEPTSASMARMTLIKNHIAMFDNHHDLCAALRKTFDLQGLFIRLSDFIFSWEKLHAEAQARLVPVGNEVFEDFGETFLARGRESSNERLEESSRRRSDNAEVVFSREEQSSPAAKRTISLSDIDNDNDAEAVGSEILVDEEEDCGDDFASEDSLDHVEVADSQEDDDDDQLSDSETENRILSAFLDSGILNREKEDMTTGEKDQNDTHITTGSVDEGIPNEEHEEHEVVDMGEKRKEESKIQIENNHKSKKQSKKWDKEVKGDGSKISSRSLLLGELTSEEFGLSRRKRNGAVNSRKLEDKRRILNSDAEDETYHPSERERSADSDADTGHASKRPKRLIRVRSKTAGKANNPGSSNSKKISSDRPKFKVPGKERKRPNLTPSTPPTAKKHRSEVVITDSPGTQIGQRASSDIDPFSPTTRVPDSQSSVTQLPMYHLSQES